jgi:N-methylhydantoinase A/oxoprolinase/acetone carboxylase beta subunit
VADIVGTTTDVGTLVRSFPREAGGAVDIGGVRTNFRMPDLLSIGLGGGSLVETAPIKVGPRSVGYALTTEGLVFGGSQMTTTDIAVAAGIADIGDRQRVRHLSKAVIKAALDEIHRMLEEAVDRVKISRADVPLVLVGGGSILIDRPLKGVSEVIVPANSSVANAVGAAIGEVGGEVDSYFDYETTGRDAVLAQVKETARRAAIAAGAEPNGLRIVELDEVPLGYLPGKTVRVRLKMIGPLDLASLAGSTAP